MYELTFFPQYLCRLDKWVQYQGPRTHQLAEDAMNSRQGQETTGTAALTEGKT